MKTTDASANIGGMTHSGGKASMLQTSRIEWIDYFRCIGILLMVMGHIGFGGKFDIWIHGFHMPMFFFISSVLYKSVTEKQSAYWAADSKAAYIGGYVSKKAKALLLPYVCVGALSYILWVLKNAQYDNYLSPLFCLLWDNSDGLPYTGALWFLTAFFLSAVIYFVIDVALVSVKHNIIWRTVLAIALGILGCALEARLPWSLNAALVGVGLMHIGWLMRGLVLKEYEIREPKATALRDTFIILVGGGYIVTDIYQRFCEHENRNLSEYRAVLDWSSRG